MLDLQTLILQMRPDLHQAFDLHLQENHERFLAWMVTNGIREYGAVAEDSAFAQALAKKGHGPDGMLTLLQHLILSVRPDVQAAFPLPAEFKRFRGWFYTAGLEEYGYWPFLTDLEKSLVVKMPAPWGKRLEPVIARWDLIQRSPLPLAQRPFGANLIGYAYGQLGIGEDVRMAARALLASGVPVTMINFQPGSDIPQNDRSMAAHVAEQGEYAINLFCLTAEENGRFYATHGRRQFEQGYNIGYWPWELGNWPKKWEMMLALVDEVWVSSRHTYDALEPVCTRPLKLMPMAVQLGPITPFATTLKARTHFGLPPKARLFCFAFDLNSSMDRKNPQACVDAFLKAFPPDRRSARPVASRAGEDCNDSENTAVSGRGITRAAELDRHNGLARHRGESRYDGTDGVGLVIKVNAPARPNRAWDKLKQQAAADKRIRIIEGTLQREDLLALYKACDCFVSLHRAEGFGRGLAEALQLGLHVICTGYSGNVDFCRPPHADLVRCRMVAVRRNQYVHTEGQVWAEPDVDHAAELMRNFVQKGPRRGKKTWPEFSPEVVGERYRQRLQEIAAEQGWDIPGP